jgi:lysylphosphatidylglycerol synthetase-like protein (DUF2156 family)
MTNFVTTILAIFGLLITILGLIAKEDDNLEIRKILTWLVFILATLFIPSVFITWLSMRISAQILALTVSDVSSFTLQVSWWTSSISMVYPLIWGISLYPKIRVYISNKILSPKTRKNKKVNNPLKD